MFLWISNTHDLEEFGPPPFYAPVIHAPRINGHWINTPRINTPRISGHTKVGRRSASVGSG